MCLISTKRGYIFPWTLSSSNCREVPFIQYSNYKETTLFTLLIFLDMSLGTLISTMAHLMFVRSSEGLYFRSIIAYCVDSSHPAVVGNLSHCFFIRSVPFSVFLLRSRAIELNFCTYHSTRQIMFPTTGLKRRTEWRRFDLPRLRCS